MASVYSVFFETDELIASRGPTLPAALAALIAVIGIALFEMISNSMHTKDGFVKKGGTIYVPTIKIWNSKPRKGVHEKGAPLRSFSTMSESSSMSVLASMASMPSSFLPTTKSSSRLLNSIPSLLPQSLMGNFSTTATKIRECFPDALTNKELVGFIKTALGPSGFDGDTSLVATSLCCDDVNRPLEKELAGIYNAYFALGGLAGVPFGGVTAFSAMASHVPDGGSLLFVYGPHVGVDSNGKVGTVNRSGKASGGACCGSAVAASRYVKGVMQGGMEPNDKPECPLDAQQTFVGNLLLPHGRRLQHAIDPMVELPFALFDAQTELIDQIVAKGCGKVAGEGKIAVLGGIQINTPEGIPGYFLPMRFDVYDNKGAVIENISRIG